MRTIFVYLPFFPLTINYIFSICRSSSAGKCVREKTVFEISIELITRPMKCGLYQNNKQNRAQRNISIGRSKIKKNYNEFAIDIGRSLSICTNKKLSIEKECRQLTENQNRNNESRSELNRRRFITVLLLASSYLLGLIKFLDFNCSFILTRMYESERECFKRLLSIDFPLRERCACRSRNVFEVANGNNVAVYLFRS